MLVRDELETGSLGVGFTLLLTWALVVTGNRVCWAGPRLDDGVFNGLHIYFGLFGQFGYREQTPEIPEIISGFQNCYPM